MAKAPLHFRAVANTTGTNSSGPLLVQFSQDGFRWADSVIGLDAEQVAAQFTRLKGKGCIIVDTEAYAHANS